MKNQRKRSLVAFVLAFAMLLSYIPATVWAADTTTDIKAIEKPTGISIVEDYDDFVGDNWLTELGLPASVTVTLADDSKLDVPVTWDTTNLDTRTTGYYSVPGTLALPDGVTNGQELIATITVQVRAYENLLSNGGLNASEKKLLEDDFYIAGSHTQVASPVKEGSYAAKTATTWTSYGTLAYNKNKTALAAAVKLIGGGQYYFGVWGRSEDVEAMKLKASLYYKTPASTSSVVTAGSQVTLNNAEFVQTSGVATLPDDVTEVQLQVRLDRFNSSGSLNGKYLYLDMMEVVALKVPLKVEPSAIEEIKTELLSRKVIANYPDYVGENWKDALGLPKTVQVLTDNGTLADVNVTWSYAGLDFTKYGKYVLEGSLDDGGFPNPKGLKVTQTIYVTKAENLLPNGEFDNAKNSWNIAWLSNVVKDPIRNDNLVLQATKKAMDTSSGGSMVLFQSKEQDFNDLVAAYQAAGKGQYYYSVDAMSAPYDESTPAREDVVLWMSLKVNTVFGSSGSTAIASMDKTALSTTEWTTISTLVNLEADYLWIRTDMNCKAGEKEPGAVYVDKIQLLPINVMIPKGEEPADIVEILDEFPAHAIVVDYDKYVGASWQTALGLPTTAKVRTATGVEANVAINWDFSSLNLAKTGKYTVVGTLDNSAYPNPEELVIAQVIHVRDYKNLLSNPSYENGKTDWSFGSGKGVLVTDKYKSGATSAKVTTSAKLETSARVQVAYVNSTNEAAQLALGEKIAIQGAGQYYFSAWAMYGGKDATSYGFGLALKYKVDLEASATSIDSERTDLSATEWMQSSNIANIPAGVQWVRLDINMFSPVGMLSSQDIYLDYAEIVPLNIIVEEYEGSMKAIETMIPDRQIIQNYPDYIGAGYTTADLMLPESLDIRSTTGEVYKIDVKWDYSALDLTKPGTYTLYGVLEDIKLDNTNGLVAKQTIKVVTKQNIFNNASFENELGGWNHHSNITMTANITSPVHTGNYSAQFDVERLVSWKDTRIQSFYNKSPEVVGAKVTKTGSGRYMFGAWVHGTSSSLDITVNLKMLYKSLSNGDSSIGVTSEQVKLSASKYIHLSNMIEMPDDVYWARLDMWINGTVEQMRLSRMYIDDFELIPLNVEIPNLTDIIHCEEVADIYVHEGSSIAGLKLPEALQVTVKNGQKFDMKVKWDTSSFDPNKIGVQEITGSLVLGTYKNSKMIVPTAKIVIRAKGEELRQTIYFSTSGDDANDGLTPETAKKDITKMNTYLKQGYNVKLKRGDSWYLPTGSITISKVYGTEDAPLVVGAYGSGEKPIIAYMKQAPNNEWKLVDEKRNVYALDVSAIGAKNGESVHRCYMNGESITHMPRNNYVALEDNQFCSYDYTLYVRLPAGQVPNNIEYTAYNAGHRLMIDNVKHLTLEQLHIRGASATSSNIYVTAPTEYLRFLHIDYTESYYFAYYFDATGSNVNYKTEVGYCTVDANLNEMDGWKNYDKNWNVGIIEGILFNNGADGAWIHHNTLIDQGHGMITLQSNGRDSNAELRGTFNCIIEDNILIGKNSNYNRAFNIAGGYNAVGMQVCRNNIIRRNKAYGMNTASHLFGEDILIYSNLMSYVHCVYEEDGSLFDGKNAQPYGWDTLIYSDKNSIGVMLVNNTFYNVSGAIAIEDKAGTVYNNIYANNLIVNYTNDTCANPGGIHDTTVGFQYVMNNGFYSARGVIGQFMVDKVYYTAEEANNAIAGYSGNLYADPKFVNNDLTNMDKDAQLDFTLSTDSPFRYTGLSLYNPVYKIFPMWEELNKEYTDINGVVYLAESPSIGAWSYCERIKGDVAEVAKLPDILMRPGGTFEQLNLPDAVAAKNDQGIEVMLLTTWSDANFDSSKPGTITLTASLQNGPHTELNIKGEVATININIKDKLELQSITTTLSPMTVLYGSTFEDVVAQLPAALDVMEESGYQEALPVTWSCEGYDATKPGNYTFKCILPEDMLTNAREFTVEVSVRLLHEIGRGMELLVNPDFTDGSSAAPWTMGWGTGTIKVNTNPDYLLDGHSGSMIVTADGRYGSAQQSVLGQMQLMGNGQYLFKMYIRAFNPAEPIDNTVAVLKVFAPVTYSVTCRAKANVGTDWVECSAIMDITDIETATDVIFHTSTYKTEEDIGRSFVIAGCSLIYLGKTEAEVEATLDSIDLTWNAIKGENASADNVMTNLTLPTSIGSGSKITWSSSDESVISNDGKITMGRNEAKVTMTATITYMGIETVRRFVVTVPRNPDLPNFSGSLSGGKGDIKVGDEFQVTISLSSDKATSFNGYRFSLSFNTTKLDFVGISDPTAQVEVEGGRVTIFGIGTDRPITDTITVTFKAKKSGITEVKLVKVEMESDPNITLETLPTMTVTDGTVVVDVLKTETAQGSTDTTETVEKDNSGMIWIVIGLVVAALIAGGAIVIILIKKKKQTPPATEE